LTVTGAAFAGAGAACFQVLFTTFPLTIPPNVTQNLQIRFSPAVAGAVTVALTGTGAAVAAAPRIVVSVQSLDFVRINQTTERSFEIRNLGNAPLVIRSMTVDNMAYSVDRRRHSRWVRMRSETSL